jgi:hypothetical protein
MCNLTLLHTGIFLVWFDEILLFSANTGTEYFLSLRGRVKIFGGTWMGLNN